MRAKLLVMCMLATSSLQAGYSYQASVSIPPAVNTDQTNDSLTVTGLDAKMRTQANGGFIRNTVIRVGQTVPADFVLSSTACVAPTLYAGWGWDFYDATTGSVKLWLLMPLHSSTVSTTVFMCYGNVSVATYQGGVQGSEFDPAIKADFHLSNGTALNIQDSSSNAVTLTNINASTATAGKIDGAVHFVSASAQQLSGPATGSVDITGTEITMSAWVNPTDRTSEHTIFGKWGTQYVLSIQATTGLVIFAQQGGIKITSVSVVPIGVLTQIVAVNTAAGFRLYLNGVLDVSNSTASSLTSTATIFSIGAQSGGFAPFNGDIDEVVLANVAWSADRVATTYANQSSPPVIGASIALVAAGAINNPI